MLDIIGDGRFAFAELMAMSLICIDDLHDDLLKLHGTASKQSGTGGGKEYRSGVYRDGKNMTNIINFADMMRDDMGKVDPKAGKFITFSKKARS